jgi:acetyl-CoA carboxylase carboxyltransferase component
MGMTMGPRVLMALVTAISAVAGPEAVAKLMVRSFAVQLPCKG